MRACDSLPLPEEPWQAPCCEQQPRVQTPEAQVSKKRKPQAPSPPTNLLIGAAVSEEPAAHWLSGVYMQLMEWLDALRSLHPACQLIPTEVALLGLGIFRQYATRTGLSYQYATTQPLVFQVTLGVCIWTAIKFLTTPGAVPSSRFMARATGVPSNLLVAFEPEVLQAVQWDIMGICKAIGMSPSEPMSKCSENAPELCEATLDPTKPSSPLSTHFSG